MQLTNELSVTVGCQLFIDFTRYRPNICFIVIITFWISKLCMSIFRNYRNEDLIWISKVQLTCNLPSSILYLDDNTFTGLDNKQHLILWILQHRLSVFFHLILLWFFVILIFCRCRICHVSPIQTVPSVVFSWL